MDQSPSVDGRRSIDQFSKSHPSSQIGFCDFAYILPENQTGTECALVVSSVQAQVQRSERLTGRLVVCGVAQATACDACRERQWILSLRCRLTFGLSGGVEPSAWRGYRVAFALATLPPGARRVGAGETWPYHPTSRR